jgi:hypothetical protein
VTRLHTCLIFAACVATLYAAAACLLDMNPDFTIAAVAAIVLLFAAVCIDHREATRRADREAGR